MKIPNPFGTGVEVGSTKEMGLVEAPETQYGNDKIASGLGKEFEVTLDTWQKRVDKTRIDEDATELQRTLIDMKTNKDTGWANLLGKDALDRPNGMSLEQETQQVFKRKYDELLAKCGTQAQRDALTTSYRAMDVQRQQEVAGHLFKQQIVYEGDVDKNIADTSMSLALNYDNPVDFESGLAGLREVTKRVCDRQGIEYDPSLGVGKAHTFNISALVDEGEYKRARSYFDRYGDEMSAEQKAKVEKLLSVAEGKDKELDYASDIISSTSTLAEALMATKDVPSAHRSAVRTLVRQHHQDLDLVRKDQRKELTKLAWREVKENGVLPASMESDLIDLGGESTVNSMNRYLVRKSEGGLKVSDKTTMVELDRMFTDHPEEAALIDLDEFSDRLTTSDLKTYANRQRNLDGTEEEKFIGLVKDYGKINDLKTKQMTALAMAAAREWDAWQERHPDEMPTRDQQKQMALSMFAGNQKWLSYDSKWEAIAENPYEDIGDLGKLGYVPEIKTDDLVRFAKGRIGLDELPVDKAALDVVNSMYLGETRAIRFTTDELNKAVKDAKKMASEWNKTHDLKSEKVVVDRQVVLDVLLHNRLSK